MFILIKPLPNIVPRKYLFNNVLYIHTCMNIYLYTIYVDVVIFYAAIK